MTLPSLAQRGFAPELMDQAGLDVAEHRRALNGLRRLNVASGACSQIWRAILSRVGADRGESVRILDVASGGGDVAFGIWKLARRQGMGLQIRGIDISETARAEATRRCAVAGGSIRFSRVDVLEDPLPSGFDVVMSSLFLHHLPSEQAIAVLAKMRAAGRHVIVSDLRRSAVGLAVAHGACRLVTRSPVVHFDGPQSVRNAFTLAEMAQLFHEAGMPEAIVRRAWPWRLLAACSRN